MISIHTLATNVEQLVIVEYTVKGDIFNKIVWLQRFMLHKTHLTMPTDIYWHRAPDSHSKGFIGLSFIK